mmetsp:Transcript_38766/g.50757  ORF Transcript_38766/g.50757 Transcript_38766/m.50757 type:complete len:162 (-) Transcript_38766:488-973(-)|eukprot:CAMPEP_0185576132 /NCGR_PEP_ID=MMETSP0434-20130131/7124_1 /TAXON_ID=626734 ORGANISM="Favella taraikaensis, Strain Fe Narragansett Bay" /NCGR_SAMPLE_ID=MMETSP0434 /ASSEMBLY_ACC=CAM_ASM_000379 /LENGTH=161 /DNA_ID=CAMNT_0028193213 /DNA_START=1420 /DNA_END=1905 /DNA_ORIENTATION=+
MHCNRCKKQKTNLDQDGKPKHLLRQQAKDEAKISGGAGNSSLTKAQQRASNTSGDRQSKVQSIETALRQVNIENKNQILDESPANVRFQRGCEPAEQQALQAGKAEQAAGSCGKKALTERVGDWLCLNCNNLNFSFRDYCNRCDMDRFDVGKTILSEQELH